MQGMQRLNTCRLAVATPDLARMPRLAETETRKRANEIPSPAGSRILLPRMKTSDNFDFGKAPWCPHSISSNWLGPLHRTCRLRDPDRRLPHWEDSLVHRALLGRLPAEAHVCFAAAATLVNEPVEAKKQLGVGRVLASWESTAAKGC